MKRSASIFLGLIAFALAACGTATEPAVKVAEMPLDAYEYPFESPYIATVVGTPEAYQAELPEKIDVQELDLTVFPEREVPDVFWYNDRLRFSLVARDHPAPLVINIAGTGADHNSRHMTLMAKALHKGGFHVLSVPSPTHPNFIINASTTGLPGRVTDDAPDLYRVMKLAYAQVRDRIEVTDFYLTGYSLGAWQAAFVAKLDEDEAAFDFKKVLMINPPVSLYNSLQILDAMAVENLPGGPDEFNAFFRKTMERFAQVYEESEAVDFEGDFLYRAYQALQPDDQRLAGVIGLAFRISSSNLIFVSDVMTNSGYIVPKNKRLTTGTSLTDYYKVGTRLGFERYLDELLYPRLRETEPNLRKEDLIREGSLESIEAYLANSPKIALLHNADDVIMAAGEIDYLRRVFGARAVIYPNGGHVGNLPHRHVINRVLAYFQS